MLKKNRIFTLCNYMNTLNRWNKQDFKFVDTKDVKMLVKISLNSYICNSSWIYSPYFRCYTNCTDSIVMTFRNVKILEVIRYESLKNR